MSKFYLPLLICWSFVLHLQAQSRHTFFVNAGPAFNPYIKLNGEEVEQSKGYTINLGLMYKVLRFKQTYTEIGFAGKTIFSTGIINEKRFRARTLRLAMPVKMVFPFLDKWAIASGFRFQNNVDVSEFDIRLRDKYSWRVDFLTEIRYQLNPLWYLNIGWSSNLRDLPDAYVINDPQTVVFIGVARNVHLFKRKKK